MSPAAEPPPELNTETPSGQKHRAAVLAPMLLNPQLRQAGASLQSRAKGTAATQQEEQCTLAFLPASTTAQCSHGRNLRLLKGRAQTLLHTSPSLRP